MTHLSMEQLLALKEPGLEPGVQRAREHLEECPVCQGELYRLDQRVAHLKALPTLKPARDRFADVRRRYQAERRRLRLKALAWGGLALAASITLAVVLSSHKPRGNQLIAVSPELQEMMVRSRELESALASFDPDRRVIDGRTANLTASIEDRVAGVDRQLEVVNLLDASTRYQEALRLWRERVGLLDALVDVHLTGARYVGF